MFTAIRRQILCTLLYESSSPRRIFIKYTLWHCIKHCLRVDAIYAKTIRIRASCRDLHVSTFDANFPWRRNFIILKEILLHLFHDNYIIIFRQYYNMISHTFCVSCKSVFLQLNRFRSLRQIRPENPAADLDLMIEQAVQWPLYERRL